MATRAAPDMGAAHVALTVVHTATAELIEVARIDVAAQLQYLQWLQSYWVELISNWDWLKCLLLVNDSIVTKGGCLVAVVAKSKTHTHNYITVIVYVLARWPLFMISVSLKPQNVCEH